MTVPTLNGLGCPDDLTKYVEYKTIIRRTLAAECRNLTTQIEIAEANAVADDIDPDAKILLLRSVNAKIIVRSTLYRRLRRLERARLGSDRASLN